uniref:Uncharacterized protein n=1 Tax=Anguilla anguilla TaxID=7936 RepID=A0A0E9VTU1_ANGAN
MLYTFFLNWKNIAVMQRICAQHSTSCL